MCNCRKTLASPPKYRARPCRTRLTLLDTNLERCAHLGWEAFSTAESGMRKLFYSSEDMLGADGTVSPSLGHPNASNSRSLGRLRELSVYWTTRKQPNIIIVATCVTFKSRLVSANKKPERSKKNSLTLWTSFSLSVER